MVYEARKQSMAWMETDYSWSLVKTYRLSMEDKMAAAEAFGRAKNYGWDVCSRQPRSQGFSTKREKPWERGCVLVSAHQIIYLFRFLHLQPEFTAENVKDTGKKQKRSKGNKVNAMWTEEPSTPPHPPYVFTCFGGFEIVRAPRWTWAVLLLSSLQYLENII